MSGHWTPGPWFTTKQGYSTIYVEAHISGGMLQEVAACGPTEVWQQQEENARLIAAAPELLEACNLMLREFSQKFNVKKDFHKMVAFEAARKAVAKATGEQP